MDARKTGSDKKPFYERIRPYSQRGFLDRRGRPVGMAMRVVLFVLVGRWLAGIWAVIA